MQLMTKHYLSFCILAFLNRPISMPLRDHHNFLDEFERVNDKSNLVLIMQVLVIF